MTHNFSIRHGHVSGTDDAAFDIPGLGVTRLDTWLDKRFVLPSESPHKASKIGTCIAIRSTTDNRGPYVELILRLDDGDSIVAVPFQDLRFTIRRASA